MMASPRKLLPSARILTASMRDIGYTLEAAIADLIDNSISADAGKVDIVFEMTSNPLVAIIDDGSGMNADQLFIAMRHGSASPSDKRTKHDLGRFGLGLKTASFSQCRQLTVASVQGSSCCAAEWDLDVVEKEDDWIISVLSEEEARQLPHVDSISHSGTVVIWRKLDRLFEDETGRRREEIVSEKIDLLEKHLSLVFHRYLAKDTGVSRKLTITINGHNLEPFDPFCRKNRATQALPEEIVRINGTPVSMQPYILPHHNRLSATEYDFYQSRSDFLSNQGAYIYRNRRLMVWGDWFRLIPKGEATKLARVQIDFPNSLDETWTIDIKKSRAKPPIQVRDRLRQIIEKIADRSISVHRGRSTRLYSEQRAPLWNRYPDRQQIRYCINRDHPLVAAMFAKLDETDAGHLDILLSAIATSLPLELIYTDYAVSPREMQILEPLENDLFTRLTDIRKFLFTGSPEDRNTFRDVIDSMRVFADRTADIDAYIEKEFATDECH